MKEGVETGEDEIEDIVGGISESRESYNERSESYKSVMTRTGSVAYCAQEPWIISTTVKENVLFGRPFHENRYTLYTRL